jgi:hypothetical protein
MDTRLLPLFSALALMHAAGGAVSGWDSVCPATATYSTCTQPQSPFTLSISRVSHVAFNHVTEIDGATLNTEDTFNPAASAGFKRSDSDVFVSFDDAGAARLASLQREVRYGNFNWTSRQDSRRGANATTRERVQFKSQVWDWTITAAGDRVVLTAETPLSRMELKLRYCPDPTISCASLTFTETIEDLTWTLEVTDSNSATNVNCAFDGKCDPNAEAVLTATHAERKKDGTYSMNRTVQVGSQLRVHASVTVSNSSVNITLCVGYFCFSRSVSTRDNCNLCVLPSQDISGAVGGYSASVRLVTSRTCRCILCLLRDLHASVHAGDLSWTARVGGGSKLSNAVNNLQWTVQLQPGDVRPAQDTNYSVAEKVRDCLH